MILVPVDGYLVVARTQNVDAFLKHGVSEAECTKLRRYGKIYVELAQKSRAKATCLLLLLVSAALERR